MATSIITGNGKYLSEILHARSEVDAYVEDNRDRLIAKINEARDRRLELVKDCENYGLKIVKDAPDGMVQDSFDRDNGGNLIESLVRLRIDSADMAQKAVKFCSKNGYLAMPIGAKTSDLSVFAASNLAKMYGLKGVIGMQVVPDLLSDKAKSENFKLNLDHVNDDDYEVIKNASGSIAVLKSKDGSRPHRVVVYPGVTVDQINEFANKKLSGSHAYRIMCDLTSSGDAHIGGVIATGAEGGNRSSVADDLVKLTLVDADGAIRDLEGEDIFDHVGLNGNTGLVAQAEFELTAFPPYEHGFFIPVKGGLEECLKLQACLQKYCISDGDDKRVKIGSGTKEIITGIEPLSVGAIDIALTNGEANKAFSEKISSLVHEDGVKYGLYVAYSSFCEDEGVFTSDIFKRIVGEIDDDTEYNDDDSINVGTDLAYDRVLMLSTSELHAMDKIRHAAPTHAKEEGERSGGETISTDMNLRMDFTDSDQLENAQKAIADLYEEYIGYFERTPGFRVMQYGHLHPGDGEGGGINIHVRVIFELNNPATRHNAPEQVTLMKKMRSKFYSRLLNLDGEFGISIRRPEKNLYKTKEYWDWLRLNKPEEAEKYLDAIQKFGVSKDGKAIFAARSPLPLPGKFLRVPNVITGSLDRSLVDPEDPEFDPDNLVPHKLRRFYKAINVLSQLTHRGPIVKRLVGETVALIHEKFGLSRDQYPFYIESPAEAISIVKGNFGPNMGGYSVEVVKVNDINDPPEVGSDPNKFYVLDLSDVLQNGVHVLIAPRQSIKDALELNLKSENPEEHRNLYSMYEKWPYETTETCNTLGIISLGMMLNEFSDSELGSLNDISCLITANPGPAQLSEGVLEGLNDLKLSPERFKEIDLMFRKFLGIEQNAGIAFYGSSSQCMSQLAKVMEANKQKLNVIQISNSPFGAKLNGILAKKLKGDLSTTTTPYTTSENSELDYVVASIIQTIDSKPEKKPIIFVTPHKTGTTADFNPKTLVDALSEKGKTLGADYSLICDVTSGVGARDYALWLTPSGQKVVPFNGMFGGVQKGLGLPPGMGFVVLNKHLLDSLDLDEEDEYGLYARLTAHENGEVVNPIAYSMLGKKLDYEKEQERTPTQIQDECAEKCRLVMGWASRHEDIMPLVQNAKDQSPLIVGLFSQSKNLVVAKRLLEDIFGYCIGGGYGPYKNEGIRLYLPNISKGQLLELLAALDLVLDLPDVVNTADDSKPNVALRETHNPVEVIEQLSNDFTPDDIFRQNGSLGWLARLVKTANANAGDNDYKYKLNGVAPDLTDGYIKKAKLYVDGDNINLIKNILDLRDHEDVSILTHYSAYLTAENSIKNVIMNNPEATYEDDVANIVKIYVTHAKQSLASIAVILKAHLYDENGNITFSKMGLTA